MKNKVGDLLIQIITVMIGVFLGFIVSNWSENNKAKNRADLLMTTIVSEIEINKGKVLHVIDYHRMLRDSSQYYLNRKMPMESMNTKFFRGVNTLTLVNSAFDAGIQTGLINEISLSKIQALNEIYARQRSYDEYGNLMLAGLFSMDFVDNEKFVKKLLIYLTTSMTDIVIKEEQLLEGYLQILKELKAS